MLYYIPEIVLLYNILHTSQKREALVGFSSLGTRGVFFFGLRYSYGKSIFCFVVIFTSAFLWSFRGLLCIHRMKIVHRDLKSGNCLVNKHYKVKICDFGLSRLLISTPMQDSSSAGTPEWMAPELIRNEPFTEKCDIFSLGVIIWELFTLKKPWEGVPSIQVISKWSFLPAPSEGNRREQHFLSSSSAILIKWKFTTSGRVRCC